MGTVVETTQSISLLKSVFLPDGHRPSIVIYIKNWFLGGGGDFCLPSVGYVAVASTVQITWTDYQSYFVRAHF